MAKTQKLELTWIGKEKRPRLEPRVLIEDPSKSHHAGVRHGENDIFDNMLIHGDNLLALKALEQEFAGKVKCIYIDPPYNTQRAFTFYNDCLKHSIWLGLMRERLALLRNFLMPEGSIWISIDEKEGHYLKVICDEIFGRENFVIQVAIKRGAVSGHKATNPTPIQVCDYMLVYAKNHERWVYHPVYAKRDYDKAYNRYIENYDEGYENWRLVPLKKVLNERNTTIERLLQSEAERIVRTAQPDYARIGKEFQHLIDTSKADPSRVFYMRRVDEPDIYLKNGERILFYRDKLRMIDGQWTTAELVTNLWCDMNYQGIAKEGGVRFEKNKKPEAQIARVLEMATNPGDLVLDTFLGSGTTAAVAHKMERRWIGVELEDNAYSLCCPRLKSVVDGTDTTGITKKYDWKGGGGYRFYELAPTLIKKDAWGQPVINPAYNAEQLSEAVCKLEGFIYAPSATEYFIHGHSTERDFIYVTTSFLKAEHQRALGELVGPERSLLVCCKGFAPGVKLDNLSVKKIPQAVLDKCEYGHDDYSLNVENLPMAAKEPTQGTLFD